MRASDGGDQALLRSRLPIHRRAHFRPIAVRQQEARAVQVAARARVVQRALVVVVRVRDLIRNWGKTRLPINRRIAP